MKFLILFQIRRYSNGVFPSITKIEYADDFFLQEVEWNEPKFQKFLECISDNFTFINDLFSFETEYYKQKNLRKIFNVVGVTILEKNCKVLEAFKIVKDIWKKNNDEIEELRDAIFKQDCSEEKKLYVDRLILFTGGHHKASNYIDRYNKHIKY